MDQVQKFLPFGVWMLYDDHDGSLHRFTIHHIIMTSLYSCIYLSIGTLLVWFGTKFHQNSSNLLPEESHSFVQWTSTYRKLHTNMNNHKSKLSSLDTDPKSHQSSLGPCLPPAKSPLFPCDLREIEKLHK